MTAAPALFSRHQRLAYAIARDYFLPGAEADDVRQEALLALWEAARAHDPDKGPFKPFARLVITRRLLDRIKTNARTYCTPTESDQEMAVDSFEILWERAELQRIRRGLPTLTPAEAAALADLLNDRWRRSTDNALTRARVKLRAAA